MDSIMKEAIEMATMSRWGYAHGAAHDSICIPHPSDGGSWGDYDTDDIREMESAVLARLAPGREIIDGGTDESGDYLILA